MNEVGNTPLEKRDKEHCEKTLGLKGKIYIENTPVKEGIQEDQIRAALRLKRKKLNKNMV